MIREGLMTAPRPVIHEHKSEIITGNLAGCHPRKVLNAKILHLICLGKKGNYRDRLVHVALVIIRH